MPTFTNLSQFVTTVTDKLTKPRRGVGGSEGVTAADMLSAMIDVGTFVSEKVDNAFSSTALKTPGTNWNTAKGVEIWGTGGTALGLPSNYLEASMKTRIGTINEMEFWHQTIGASFKYTDGALRTERFRLASGHGWLSGNLHVGVGADRTQRNLALYVAGSIGIDTISATSAKLEIESGSAQYPLAILIRSSTHATSRRAVLQLGNWQFINDVNADGGTDFAFYSGHNMNVPLAAASNGDLHLNRSLGDAIIGSSTNLNLGKLQITGDAYVSNQMISDGAFYARKNGSAGIVNTFFQQSISGTTYAMNMQMSPTGGIVFWTFNGSWANRLTIKDTGQLRFVPLAAAPAGAENGDMYYNNATHKFMGYANGAWVALH